MARHSHSRRLQRAQAHCEVNILRNVANDLRYLQCVQLLPVYGSGVPNQNGALPPHARLGLRCSFRQTEYINASRHASSNSGPALDRLIYRH